MFKRIKVWRLKKRVDKLIRENREITENIENNYREIEELLKDVRETVNH